MTFASRVGGIGLLATIVAAVCVLSPFARADDSIPTSNTPYIDQIKKRMQEEGQPATDASPGGSNQPYIDSIKQKLKGAGPKSPNSNEEYIDSLRQQNPSLNPGGPPPGSGYSDTQKALLAPKTTGGAIEAVQSGRSDLEMKRNTDIHYSGGFWIGTPLVRNFTASGSAATPFTFSQIYGNNTLPDFSAFFEWMPFHSERFISFGVITMFGLTYASAPGQFGVSGISLGASHTQFHFFEIPVGLGIDARINLAKYIKPVISIAPMAIGYLETRNDGVSGNKGYSTGFVATGGLWILLDWISPKTTWDIYYDTGVKHTYLTANVEQVTTLSGPVTFDDTAFILGFSFEF